MVKSVWPLLTSLPISANSAVIRPWYGVNTCTVMSWSKSIEPTASFSTGKSRSATGSTLTEVNCKSDRSTLPGPPDAAFGVFPDGPPAPGLTGAVGRNAQ